MMEKIGTFIFRQMDEASAREIVGCLLLRPSQYFVFELLTVHPRLNLHIGLVSFAFRNFKNKICVLRPNARRKSEIVRLKMICETLIILCLKVPIMEKLRQLNISVF
jgi:hypothetical protein